MSLSTLSIASLLTFNHSYRYVQVSHCGFNLHFYTTDDHILGAYLLFISLIKSIFKNFCIILLSYLFSYLLSLESTL